MHAVLGQHTRIRGHYLSETFGTFCVVLLLSVVRLKGH